MQKTYDSPPVQSVKQVAELIGISPRRVRKLAAEGRIVGAFLHEREGWLIPYIVNVRPGKRGPALTEHRKKHRS